MGQPFIGEIRMFGGNFAPTGWAFCNGQLMAISENDTLFALIGTTYGGDGQSTFGLPDLRGRLPVHQGSGYTIGELSGSEDVTLTSSQLPQHSHPLACVASNGSLGNPQGNVIAGGPLNMYTATAADTPMGAQIVGNAGGSQPHSNLMPSLCVSFIISIFGIFPTQN